MNCVIDASVFVAASRSTESHYAASNQFLQLVQELKSSIFCPTIVLAECSAAIARQTDKSELAEMMVKLIKDFPGLRLVDLSITLASQAAQIAADYRLRGADSVYAAVAKETGATLITWDAEML